MSHDAALAVTNSRDESLSGDRHCVCNVSLRTLQRRVQLRVPLSRRLQHGDGCPLRHHGMRLLVGSSPPTQRCVAVPVRLLLFRIFHRQAPKPLRMHRRHNWRALVAVLVGIALPAPGWVLVSLMSRERVPTVCAGGDVRLQLVRQRRRKRHDVRRAQSRRATCVGPNRVARQLTGMLVGKAMAKAPV